MKVSPHQTNQIPGPQGKAELSENQVVHGRVVGRTDAGPLLLSLLGRRYTATIRGSENLQPGQSRLFRVNQTQPHIELSVLGNPSQVKHQENDGMLTSTLPQSYVKDPGAALQSLLGTNNIRHWVTASALLQALTRKISQKALTTGKFSGKLFRQLFLHSGLFMEPLQSSAGSQRIDGIYHPSDDLKLLLLLLARESGTISRNNNTLGKNAALRAYNLHGMYSPLDDPVSKDCATQNKYGLLAYLAEESLGRVVENQVKSLNTHHSGETKWYFELPVYLCTQYLMVPVTISREDQQASSGGSQEAEQWRVTFSIESSELGLMEAVINIRKQQVIASIETDTRKTAEKLCDRKAELINSFAANGLKLTLSVGILAPDKGKR